jgi:NADH:ubiquinone oxidoreductase subunit 5 (subunit L)/multisubunit Na+/H+ antiporter MnhA subunit
MELGELLPLLLAAAWLLPLASFTLIVFFGPRMGKAGVAAGYLATAAILGSFVLSLAALVAWLGAHPLAGGSHHAEGGHASVEQSADAPPFRLAAFQEDAESDLPAREDANDEESAHGDEAALDEAAHAPSNKDGAAGPAPDEHAAQSHDGGDSHDAAPPVYSGDWYSLGEFGDLRITIGYYIDALTVAMFAMVTLIATCIHFYATGYMHDELHEVTDHEVKLADGHHLHRKGRFHRFFQYLSLFCFSMLGLVIAGNIAMVFVFWELVGICSYFLIGFYIERTSASTAANKAFIVNRVGDFGMIIGLMALWSGLGTFSFGDWKDGEGATRPGIFSQVRPADSRHQLIVPDGLVKLGARDQVAAIVRSSPTVEAAAQEVEAHVADWRNNKYGYWLLVIAGLGIFCGCVGKSAQFPLHTWLPDAMEGPTPVSALVHSATMVAAGVYLVGRFYPVFSPEVLLVIAYTGAITLFLAATIAITATDIKRVLAYSTVSQLGFMMLALGVGGWLAGLFHLFTHAFFKSLLFMCSGSVIHACHTNEMPKMGGLRKKMPWTAYTMLIGCLAIAGAPFFSGFYSKDSIVAQAINFAEANPAHGILFYAVAVGAAITAFYMFRLWYMTFTGKPRDHHIYDHAHESPKVMYVPLVVLSVFAVGIGWDVPFTNLNLPNLIEQARYPGTVDHAPGVLLTALDHPDEHASHGPEFHNRATAIATAVALAGFLLASVFYGLRLLNADDARRTFAPFYNLFRNKWYFDEIYDFLFVRPVMAFSRLVSNFDKKCIDWIIDNTARGVRVISVMDDWFDRLFIDGLVNLTAAWTYSLGSSLRGLQTGKLRQYVMFIVVGTIVLLFIVRWGLTWAAD